MQLNKEKINQALSEKSRSAVGEIYCFNQLDSTNRWLLDHIETDQARNVICLADTQTAGVGRGGKAWRSGDGQNILFSFAYQFDLKLEHLSGLSLVTGIAIVNALNQLGVSGLSLKWPNDVYMNGAKLSGILIQTRKHPCSGYWAVIGVGLNVVLDSDDIDQVSQPVAQLSESGINPQDRELVIAGIMDQFFIQFEQFRDQGFESFIERWNQLDLLSGHRVNLIMADKVISGDYLGVNRVGGVQLRLPNNQISEYYVGEVSLRKSAQL